MVEVGQFVSEIALWADWVHVGAAVSEEPCQLVSVRREPFQKACLRYPASLAGLRKYAALFVANFAQGYHNGGYADGEQLDDLWSDSDTIEKFVDASFEDESSDSDSSSDLQVITGPPVLAMTMLRVKSTGSGGGVQRVKSANSASGMQRVKSAKSIGSSPGMQRVKSAKSIGSSPGMQRVKSAKSIGSATRW
eukprot:gnl/TRDRNA2_/TRDRNA2_60818_c0_seq1.p1 gnl/TRDRNA2_/TRDRNA2_60818_c0~~gnl/TRDRNA2_/TRDRNA2_60818_c0_seq1.p1  ORF type:complete len:209 (+),score=32.53 gnl/TRDRNA2_/TRDRNA2_60818_c0_seq1:49-627(+)